MADVVISNALSIAHLFSKLGAAIDSAVRIVTSEYSRALCAAASASSPNRTLSDIRAMYLPTSTSS